MPVLEGLPASTILMRSSTIGSPFGNIWRTVAKQETDSVSVYPTGTTSVRIPEISQESRATCETPDLKDFSACEEDLR